MSRKLAIKRLTSSDLTLFKWHFRNRPAGKQKAINMDANVLVRTLYPSFAEVAATLPKQRVPLDLSIFGPGLAGLHNLQRKILKQEKNWRLDGELIDNPEDAPDRYNLLRENDFAIIEFTGTPVPVSAKMVLISAHHKDDAKLHAELAKRFGAKSMSTLDPSALEELIGHTAPTAGHPIYDWVDGDTVEDVALGGAIGTEKLLNRRRGRGLSREDLLRAKAAAENVGQHGEELLNFYLTKLKEEKRIEDFEWISSGNAIAPCDFHEKQGGKLSRVIEVKSTSGGFENPVHISLGELTRCIAGPEPYDIYRLYEVGEFSAKLRIARNVASKLKSVLQVAASCPASVTVDAFSVIPTYLDFGDEVVIQMTGSDEGTK